MDESEVTWSNKNDTNKVTFPIHTQSARYQDTLAAMPNDKDVKATKDWAQEHQP